MTTSPTRLAHKVERCYHFASHFLFYVIFPLSVLAFITALRNPDGPTFGIAGQPIKTNHVVVLLVFITMTIATGYGAVKSVIRDIRHMRQRKQKVDSSPLQH